MIPKEIFAQVRRIEIRTRRLVTETFGGQYLSVFKGRGMEFSEVREYSPGDDIRSIDWNVTARTGKPYVRRYQDERELTVIVACDLSASQNFGTGLKLKKEISAEICALLAFSALQNNDKVGLCLFTRGPELYRAPKKGRSHILTLIRELLAFVPCRGGTCIASTLDTLNRLLKRRSILFLVSDFMDAGFQSSLRRTALRHDLVPVLIEDPREREWPALPAWVETEDPETGARGLLDARSKAFRKELELGRGRARLELEKLFKSCGLQAILVRTDRPYVDPIARFFRERSKRPR